MAIVQRRIGFSIAAAVAIGLAAAAMRPAPTQPDVVVITLDTARADRLPAYGFASVSTPALDRLAREGTVFTDAMTVAPLTLTAHTSLFTGLYPPHHGVRDNADAPLAAAHETLASNLHARGFRTAAFVGSMVLGAERGLAAGFDLYDDGSEEGSVAPRRRPANEVIDRAVRWVQTTPDSSRFLLWVHLYDLHAIPTPPEPYRSRYGGDQYVAAIAFADAQIDRLLAAIGPRLDRTIVVVAGDHGESLGEHGETEHGIFLYQAPLHVPLIVRAPGVAPARLTDPVSLVDVEPTILDLLGWPSRSVDGVSLASALTGKGLLPERRLYAESMYPRHFGWAPLRAIRDGRFKFIDAPRPELYDLEPDPLERHDIASERPAVVRGMRVALAAFEANGAPARGGSPLSSEARDRLAALGYLSGPLRMANDTNALDPKDFIEIFNASRQHQLK